MNKLLAIFCLIIFVLKADLITAQNDSIAYLSILSPLHLVDVYHQEMFNFRAASGWGVGILNDNIVAPAKIPL